MSPARGAAALCLLLLACHPSRPPASGGGGNGERPHEKVTLQFAVGHKDLEPIFRRAAEQVASATDGRVRVLVGQGDDAAKWDGALLPAAQLGKHVPGAEVFNFPLVFDEDEDEAAELVDIVGVQLVEESRTGKAVVVGWVGLGWLRLFADAKLVNGFTAPSADRWWELVAEGETGTPVFHVGRASGFLASTAAALEHELHRKVGHLFGLPIARLTGAVVFDNDSLLRLAPADRAALLQAFAEAAAAATAARRELDRFALVTMIDEGLVVDEPSPELRAILMNGAAYLHAELAGSDAAKHLLADLSQARRARTALSSDPPAPGPPALAAAAAEAPEDLRALWLAFDECDAEMLSLFVQFPLSLAGTRYATAASLAKACKGGALAWPPAAALEAALPALQVTSAGAALTIGGHRYLLEWQAQSWMLVGME